MFGLISLRKSYDINMSFCRKISRFFILFSVFLWFFVNFVIENEIQNFNNSRTNRRYSDEIKQFCLTLHFYSPKAYDFLRQRSCLPDPSTIHKWISTRVCKPGILAAVLASLKEQN